MEETQKTEVKELIADYVETMAILELYVDTADGLEISCPTMEFTLFGKKIIGVPIIRAQGRVRYLTYALMREFGLTKAYVLNCAKENLIKFMTVTMNSRKRNGGNE